MGRKKDLCQSASGVFVRNLGWKVTPAGGYVQHKFYLGRDETKARLASLRLEQLWEQASRRWVRENETELYPTDRPVWDETTLAIAEAVRNGEPLVRISLPFPISAFIPESPQVGYWLDHLQEDISVIKIELVDPRLQEKSEEYLEKQGQRLMEMGRRMIHKKAGGENLHAALDAYCKWIDATYLDVEKRPTLWAGMQKRQVKFLKRYLTDGPLAALDASQIERLIDILRLRPNGDDGKPVSVSWTKNCIKQLRHFLRWLNKAPEFAWKRPSDLEFGQVRIPTTPSEKAATIRSSKVQTYTFEELKLLWEYAAPFQRLLMLLALNCGFGRAEIASLEFGDVHLRTPHPRARDVGVVSTSDDSWILRIRNKTGVYGEFKLWPETVRAIEWWLDQRQAVAGVAHVTALLVNRKGHRFDTPTKGNHANFQIPNAWFQLSERIRKDHADFRRLSFNKLRKTAGNLVRHEADGETAGIFLCHGKPVRSDDLLDLYTNRPFAKVFKAIDSLDERLSGIWKQVDSPFPVATAKGGPNISRGTIKRIQMLKKQGFSTGHIAEKLGVSTGTVRRWATEKKT